MSFLQIAWPPAKSRRLLEKKRMAERGRSAFGPLGGPHFDQRKQRCGERLQGEESEAI